MLKTMQETEQTPQSDRNAHAETIIRNHVVWSMGAGFIPILIADIFAVSALQLDMIRQLCRVYNVNFSETQGKAIVTALTSTTLARVTAGSLVKIIPGVGSLLGGATVSVFAGASTYALGEVFKKHFETGGTILDFDPARLRKLYKEKFEKGKKVADELRKKEQPAPSTSSKGGFVVNSNSTAVADPLERLRELATLKEQGVITDEEFQQMKKKLIDGME